MSHLLDLPFSIRAFLVASCVMGLACREAPSVNHHDASPGESPAPDSGVSTSDSGTEQAPGLLTCSTHEPSSVPGTDSPTCPDQLALSAGPEIELGEAGQNPLLLAADLDADGSEEALVLQHDELVVWRAGEAAQRYPFPFVVRGASDFVDCAFVADVDADGAPDVVASSTLEAPMRAIAVLLNDGRGAFGEAVVTVLEADTEALAAGDLIDGKGADLLLRSQHDGSAYILSSQEDGRFDGRTDLPTILVGYAAAIGQLDGKGKLDIATAAHILLSKEDGTFSATPLAAREGGTSVVFIADLDGDSDPDLLLWSRSGHGETLLNDGAGNFARDASLPRFGSAPEYSWSEQVRDVDCDGRADFLFAKDHLRYGSSSQAGLRYAGWLGYRNGQTCEPLVLTYGDVFVPADVNGDGDVDVFVMTTRSVQDPPFLTLRAYLRGPPEQ